MAFISEFSYSQNKVIDLLSSSFRENQVKLAEERNEKIQILLKLVEDIKGNVNKSTENNYYNYYYRPEPQVIYVNSYFKSNGTYIEGHYKTKNDNSFWNNWSSYGNINPITGKVGNKKR